MRHQRRWYAGSRDDDLVVHEYEQYGKSKKSRVGVNPKAGLDETGEYLRSKIERLDNELAELKEGPFGPNSEFMQSLSPEEREIALQALKEEGMTSLNDLEDVDLKELDRLVEDPSLETNSLEYEAPPQVTLRHPKEHQVYIRIFNIAIQRMAGHQPTEAERTALLRSYERCRQHIPHFSSLVPAKAWGMLWQSSTELPNKAKKLRMLAEDMLSQSISLSPQQMLVYMESLRELGRIAAAIECWKENRSTMGPNFEVAARFWALGVQLYSDMDEPKEAENIAMQCLTHGSFVKATILEPVIGSWIRKDTVKGLARAWACYLRFKAELDTEISSEDYERISTKLLQHGHTGMALSVFRDMVLDKAQPEHKEPDSVSTFRDLTGHIGELQASAITEQDVSRLSLAALTVLPRSMENKFFYASWIKRLIGLGNVDAASKVVELMYERGIRPDAKHLNGILGAWLREDSTPSGDKAEKLGWAMINARIEFVGHRQNGTRPEKLTKTLEGRDVPIFIHRLIPAATVETFAIMLLYYTRRRKDDLAKQLMEVMTTQAMIAPNSFILNHWLYASLRKQDLQSVWSQYSDMKTTIIPDLETFACLWDAAKVQWDNSRSAHWNSFPTARKLFREMHDWMLTLHPSQLTRSQQEFSRDLYDQIVRVFCLSRDLRGTLCALHGLKRLFNEYPDTVTSRIIVIQIARLLPPDPGRRPTGRRESRRRVSGMKTAMSAVNEILQLVTDQRIVAIMDEGLDPQELDEAAKKQFQLDVLSDLLVVVLKRLAVGTKGQVSNEVQMVANEMGFALGGEEIDFRDGK